MRSQPSWSESLRLSELGHGAVERRLVPDAAVRASIAADLDLVDLPELSADLEVSPWLDGARVRGRWRACVVQTCGVTLEPYESALEGEISIRAVPEGSLAAPTGETDVALDPQSEDPPDVLAEDRIDLAAYVLEHLVLEIDPYPRKPGVEFVPPEPERESSPFDILKTLKPDAT